MTQPTSYLKLKCQRSPNGDAYIRCPKCGVTQKLPQTDEWYMIESNGKVFPIFVCMARNAATQEPTCPYEGMIWIMNWKPAG